MQAKKEQSQQAGDSIHWVVLFQESFVGSEGLNLSNEYRVSQFPAGFLHPFLQSRSKVSGKPPIRLYHLSPSIPHGGYYHWTQNQHGVTFYHYCWLAPMLVHNIFVNPMSHLQTCGVANHWHPSKRTSLGSQWDINFLHSRFRNHRLTNESIHNPLPIFSSKYMQVQFKLRILAGSAYTSPPLSLAASEPPDPPPLGGSVGRQMSALELFGEGEAEFTLRGVLDGFFLGKNGDIIGIWVCLKIGYIPNEIAI